MNHIAPAHFLKVFDAGFLGGKFFKNLYNVHSFSPRLVMLNPIDKIKYNTDRGEVQVILRS